MKPRLFALILLAASIASPAEARHRKPDPPSLAERIAGAVAGFVRKAAASATTTAASAGEAISDAPRRLRAASYGSPDGEQAVPRPEGCPATLYCGCGVSVRVYGHPVRELYAAASWRRFPKASCAPGHVAVWGTAHVAYILSCGRDGTAELYDPNGGQGRTWIHRRELPNLIVEPPANL